MLIYINFFMKLAFWLAIYRDFSIKLRYSLIVNLLSSEANCYGQVA
jgi:hypothetical protein